MSGPVAFRQSWRDYISKGDATMAPTDRAKITREIIRHMEFTVAEYDAFVVQHATNPAIREYMKAVEKARAQCHSKMQRAADAYAKYIRNARTRLLSEASKLPGDARWTDASKDYMREVQQSRADFDEAQRHAASEYLGMVRLCVSDAITFSKLLDAELEVNRLYNEKESKA